MFAIIWNFPSTVAEIEKWHSHSIRISKEPEGFTEILQIWKYFSCFFTLFGMSNRRRMFYLSHTQYNQQWNVFSAFNPSKCTHTWSSGQPMLWRPGSSWGFGALLKGLTSVVDNSCRSRDSNPQPRVTSPTLYPLGHSCPQRSIDCVFSFINSLQSHHLLVIPTGC